jgi:hypothetical protein
MLYEYELNFQLRLREQENVYYMKIKYKMR